MSYTKTQLINAALEELNVSSVGNPATGEEYQNVDVRINAILADLSARNIFYVGNVDAIDDAAFESLVSIVANKVKRSFGVEAQISDYLEKKAKEAEDVLRVITRETPTRETLAVDPAIRPSASGLWWA